MLQAAGDPDTTEMREVSRRADTTECRPGVSSGAGEPACGGSDQTPGIKICRVWKSSAE